MRGYRRLTWLERAGALAALGLPIAGVLALLLFG